MYERAVTYGAIKPGEPDVHVVDGYEVTCGSSKQMIYMDRYHCEQPPPTSPPPGFAIRATSVSASETAASPVPPKPVSGGEQDPIGDAVQGVRRLFDRIFSGEKSQ